MLDESATGGLGIGAPLEQEPDFLCHSLYHAVTHGDTAKVHIEEKQRKGEERGRNSERWREREGVRVRVIE